MIEQFSQQSKTQLPLSRLFPNFVTIMAICFGLTAIQYALNQNWEKAVAFVIIAAFLDVVDGRLARFLKATSNFGAQLDSLADFVNFGVAPALIVYLWKLNQVGIKGLGWTFVLFYAICSAIRLARFNSDLSEPDRPAWRDGFFTGVPAPMGAYLVILPMILSFETSIMKNVNPSILGFYTIIIGLLMASRLPTFSTKKISIQKEHISFMLVIVGALLGIIIIEPWISLAVLGIIYMASFPFSFRSFKRVSKEIIKQN